MLNIEVQKTSDKVASEWREYKDDKGNVLAKFLIAGSKRPAYQKGLELMQAQFEREMIGLVKVDDKSALYTDNLIATAGKYLLLDWEGIATADGEFKFSTENAVTLLTKTKDGLLLWKWIEDQAKDIQAKADDAVNNLVGKSLNSTTTARPSGTARSKKASTRPSA